MNHGVAVPNSGAYFHPLIAAKLASDAEAAGWDGFFIQTLHPFAGLPVVDPWVALSAIALNTRRLRLGTLAVSPPGSAPVILARQAVSLDHLSSGRLILGVESGSSGGLTADEDRQLLFQTLDRISTLWQGAAPVPGGAAGPAQSERGSEPQFAPPPVQTPRIPIWISGLWPDLELFLEAGQWDGIAPHGSTSELMSPDDLLRLADLVAKQRGDRPSFEFVVRGRTPGDNANRARTVLAPYLEAGMTWWIETIDPRHFGWTGAGPWPISAMNRRVHAGPPGT